MRGDIDGNGTQFELIRIYIYSWPLGVKLLLDITRVLYAF